MPMAQPGGGKGRIVRNVVFFDVETQRTADEVGGWENAAEMRVSVAVTYATLDGRYHVYEESDVPLMLDELFRADVIVGFNIRAFDYAVLSRYTERSLEPLPTLDLLEDITRQAGHRVKLDNLARTTLGEGKSGEGLGAVGLFAEGRMLELVDYCRRDVEVTKGLYEYGVRHRRVKFTDNVIGEVREIVVDWGRHGE
jgi:DEAD/DEAH box helicase domain-containing protein